MVLPASFKTVKFTDIDTNGSAYISFGEFRAAVKKHDENACDNAIFDLFKKYCDSANEANKEGGDITYSASYDKSMINQKEYYNMLAKEFPKPPEVKFEDVDANGSGFISKQEFLNFALKVNSEDEEPLCEELLTAQVVAVFDEFSNQINDGKGNEGTVYSEGYDKDMMSRAEFDKFNAWRKQL